MMSGRHIENPFRPGAGQMPPVVAGRESEIQTFRRTLAQDHCSKNILVTGGQGYGKTVLLSEFKRIAAASNWIWVGNDISETSSLTEGRLAIRILTDLSEAISDVLAAEVEAASPNINKAAAKEKARNETYKALVEKYELAPGFPTDKLKSVLGRFSRLLKRIGAAGIVIAYDEAQRLCDHAEKNEFPLTMLIETVAALQKTDETCPILLVLSGSNRAVEVLISTRTYAERMFEIVRLHRLNRAGTLDALAKPLVQVQPPLHFANDLIEKAAKYSCGHPYLVQFLGKEMVEAVFNNGGMLSAEKFPTQEAYNKLDTEVFEPRWRKLTEPQKSLLASIARISWNETSDFSADAAARFAASNGQFEVEQVRPMLEELRTIGLLVLTATDRYSLVTPLAARMVLQRVPAVPPELSVLVTGWVGQTPQPDKPEPPSAEIAAHQEGANQELWYRGVKVEPKIPRA